MDGSPPSNLESVNAAARLFPASWRDAAIRRCFDPVIGGIKCLSCGRLFAGRKGLMSLHADHIIPWSKGGLTIWGNLQLLCGKCNIRKGNR
jgi:5-methylcytosine-specific restriction endonuclease McrA